jgi:hypothetical protein
MGAKQTSGDTWEGLALRPLTDEVLLGQVEKLIPKESWPK